MKAKKKRLRVLAAVLLILLSAALIYVSVDYRADETALAALQSDGGVSVTQTDYGWLFDGPSETDALIFYAGGKVEETAYAPLLRQLAAQGMDVCLLRLPLRLAVLAPNAADRALSAHTYDNWYAGGHSLGGTFAAIYAAGHPGALRGLVLLAAYPDRPLEQELEVLTVCGSEDGVINRERLAEGERYLPRDAVSVVIPGGNHAQFGCYGAQRGDGEASISPEEQQAETARLIAETIG